MSDFKKILEEECVKYGRFRTSVMPDEFKNIIRQPEKSKDEIEVELCKLYMSKLDIKLPADGIVKQDTPKAQAETIVREYYTWGLTRREGSSLSWYECKQLAKERMVQILDIIGDAILYKEKKRQFWRDVEKEIDNV